MSEIIKKKCSLAGGPGEGTWRGDLARGLGGGEGTWREQIKELTTVGKALHITLNIPSFFPRSAFSHFPELRSSFKTSVP